MSENNKGFPIVLVGFILVISLLIAMIFLQDNERRDRLARERQAKIEKALRVPPVRMVPMVHCFGENQRTCMTLEVPAMPDIE